MNLLEQIRREIYELRHKILVFCNECGQSMKKFCGIDWIIEKSLINDSEILYKCSNCQTTAFYFSSNPLHWKVEHEKS